MKIRTAIVSLLTAAVILLPQAPAHAATAAPGMLRCEGGSTVIASPPSVSVGAGEPGGYFAWLPALVNLNGHTPTVAQYGAWQYGYAHPGQTTPYWQRFDSGIIQSFESFVAPTTGRWAIYNFGYDYRTRQSFAFGYSSTTATSVCTFAPSLFIPNP